MQQKISRLCKNILNPKPPNSRLCKAIFCLTQRINVVFSPLPPPLPVPPAMKMMKLSQEPSLPLWTTTNLNQSQREQQLPMYAYTV